MPTFDWTELKSKTLVARRVADYSGYDYDESDAWQDYIVAHVDRRRGDHLQLTIRDDATDYTFTGGRLKNGKIVATATVPSTWFIGRTEKENRPVHRDIKQRFFTDLAQACDLPAPPPPPPVLELPPEWGRPGTYAGIAFLSERKGFRTPRVDPGAWFHQDDAWQDYLGVVANDTLSLVISILDRETVRRSGRRKPNGEITVYLDLPTEWFINNPDPDLTLVEALRDTYVWGMKKFGWPEPPPLPSRPVHK